jgi:hypothetical protein
MVLSGGVNNSGLISYTYVATLPKSYSNLAYERRMVLAGYDVNIRNMMKFTLDTAYLSDTTASINIGVYEPGHFYRLSVFVVINKGSSYVFIRNSSTHTATQPTSAPPSITTHPASTSSILLCPPQPPFSTQWTTRWWLCSTVSTLRRRRVFP